MSEVLEPWLEPQTEGPHQITTPRPGVRQHPNGANQSRLIGGTIGYRIFYPTHKRSTAATAANPAHAPRRVPAINFGCRFPAGTGRAAAGGCPMIHSKPKSEYLERLDGRLELRGTLYQRMRSE